MLETEPLTEDNFVLYAAHNYDCTSSHGTAEFLEDLKRFRYIKKLITRYVMTGVLKTRLVLNHIIVLNNVFGPDALARMMFLKIGMEQMAYVKPFMVALSIMPDIIYSIGERGRHVETALIGLDQGVIDALREIYKP